jgi:uncharacterized protein (DUF1778 family)
MPAVAEARAEARTDRLDLRLSTAEKAVIKEAADHEQVPVSAFVLRYTLRRAQNIVNRAKRIELSEHDTARVLALLDNPPAPPPALLKAVNAKYGQ